MPRSGRAFPVRRQPLWEQDGLPFRLDAITVWHQPEQRSADSPEPPLEKTYVSFERGDSVAALIVNRDTGQVVLVNQFRPPIMDKDDEAGALVELPAGMIRQNETPEQCLQREIAEETGYALQYDPDTGRLRGVEFIADYYPTPGGSSERIKLFYVEVDGSTAAAGPEVRPDPGEFIDKMIMSLDEFTEHLRRPGYFKDGKLLIAGYWALEWWRNRPLGFALRTNPGERQDFRILGPDGRPTGKSIGYRTGDIDRVRDIDIWVNSENTQFNMDRLFGTTLSARIRTLGASFENGKLLDDTIQELLFARLGVGSGIATGNVIDTEPGRLGRTHAVRRLLHAAAVETGREIDGVPELHTDVSILVTCVQNALEQTDRLNVRMGRKPYRSIIFPLLGAGLAGLDAESVARRLIPVAIDHLRTRPTKLEQVCFLAYRGEEIEICDRILSRQAMLQRIPAE